MSVYFLRPVGMEGPIKIGFSDQPKRRLKELTMWSPVPLELVAMVPGNRALESMLHRAFADAKSHWEWFHPIPEIVTAIERLAAGREAHEAFDIHRHRRGRVSLEYAARTFHPWPPIEEQAA